MGPPPDADLKDQLHRRPRECGQATSLWTLAGVADVCHQKGWAPRVQSAETIRQPQKRLGGGWTPAEHWVTSPDPRVRHEQKARGRLIARAARQPDWVLGFPDECWWAWLARTARFAWPAADPSAVGGERPRPEGGGPEAVACDGVLRLDAGRVMLRSCDGRSVRATTEDVLGWVCETLAAEGKRPFVRVWDNAAWHVSGRVRR